MLTVRQLNRATLVRQLLTARVDLSPSGVIAHLVGMQAQWPPAPYLGIWTRATNFTPNQLEDAIGAGEVLKATVMRETLHLVTRRDYGLIRAALADTNHLHNRPVALAIAPGVRSFADSRELVTMDDALAYLEAEHGLTGEEARQAWHGARVRAHVLHHPDTALWRSRPRGRFAAVEEPAELDSLESRVELLSRYLSAFGPATRQDIRTWAMMAMPEIRAALDVLDERGVLVRDQNEQGRELLDIAGAPLPDPDLPVPVRFLPKWDNILLAWADRTRILPEEYRRTVFRLNGEVVQTFLIDGFVAGTWRAEAGRVKLEPFRRISAADRRELRSEAERLEQLLAA